MALRAHPDPLAFPRVHAATIPRLTASTALRERLWNMLPLSLSLFLASSIVWGPYLAPWLLGGFIVAFFAYWLIRSYSVAIVCLIGLRRLSRWKRINWVAKYCEWLPGHPGAEAWEWPQHMVIIPNYKESEHSLRRTLDSLAAQAVREQIVVVMAMEAREPAARAKATRLLLRYRSSFADMFATYHPAGIPGETPGKGSNEAWAAREAHRRLVVERGEDIARYSVTSCDADAVFHKDHFSALNYLFLTAKDRYHTFWQPAIFNTNNIWEIPAPLRVPEGLSGINRLSNLILPGSVRFPTSCYSLSWQMLDAVDYWDEEVISEDWHVYLKCSFTLGDRVHVEPIFLPLGNDCVLTDSYGKTLKAHYAQSVRHAWGASDIPYAWRAYRDRRSPIGRVRGFFLAGAVTKVHSLWMAQWYLITLGAHVPMMLTDYAGARMPDWWLARPFKMPGPGWHFSDMVRGDFSDPISPWVHLTLATFLIYFCLFPLIVLIVVELKTRGPRPAYFSRKAYAAQLLVWPCMAFITFVWASMPALHAQWKLATGKALIYRVAEKGTFRAPAPVPAAATAIPEGIPVAGAQ